MKPYHISTAELEERMRHLPIPVVARTANDRIVIDVRTVERRFFKTIVEQLKEYDVLGENCLITR